MPRIESGSFWGSLASATFYKRTQGRLVRQLTGVAAALIVGLGAYSLSLGPLIDAEQPIRVGVPLALAAAGCWLAFRIVNYPPFADFLIAVQAEMDKVSWPSRKELQRSTVVVICTMFVLGAVLFVYDLVWAKVLELAGVLQL